MKKPRKDHKARVRAAAGQPIGLLDTIAAPSRTFQTTHVRAGAIVRKLAALDPRAPSEVDGSLSCFFCGEPSFGSALAPSPVTEHNTVECVWCATVQLLRDEPRL